VDARLAGPLSGAFAGMLHTEFDGRAGAEIAEVDAVQRVPVKEVAVAILAVDEPEAAIDHNLSQCASHDSHLSYD